MDLGTTEEAIAKAETEMGVSFPDGLKKVWLTSNGLELSGGWRLFPVFDPREPRKTCGHIGNENTRERWSYMDESLVSIADGDTGNQLVLVREGQRLGDIIYLWNHETRRIRKWGKGFDYLLAKAQARIARIEKQVAKSLSKRESEP